MNTATWLVLLAFATGIAGYIGYLAGREGAESRAAATIADLRVSLRRQGLIPARDTQANRYPRDDSGRSQ